VNRSGYSLIAICSAIVLALCWAGCSRQTEAGAGAEPDAGDGNGGGTGAEDGAEPAQTPGQPCDGYTLFSMGAPQAAAVQATTSPSESGPGATLVDMEGTMIHRWPIPGFPALMLPGGSILGTRGNFANSLATNEVLQLDWNGNEQWSYSGWYVDETGQASARQHHDYQREGNPVGYYAPGRPARQKGNTLILAHTDLNAPELYPEPMLDDVIYEIDWQGNLTVFEWHGIDHFDEMGLTEAMKEAIRITPPALGLFDWLHLNSIARLGENRWYDGGDKRFHPENIIFSARNTDTIAIISHLSGDIVWRVGPDFSEGRPEHALGNFIGQHHAHMIPRGLPGEGNILLFDNGGRSGYAYSDDPVGSTNQRDWSRVVEFDPVDLTIVWQYGQPSGPEHMLSLVIGSAQRLPNGNTLINIGIEGRIIEVTPEKEIVWEYTAPPVGDTGNNSIYRAYRIPPEWLPEGENPGGYQRWDALYEP
jgi:hypothetical protein